MKFSQAKVLEFASSLVQIVINNPPLRIGSGMLIAPQVVLCARHSLEMASPDIKILMDFECDTRTAPPGAFFQYERAQSTWPSCTELATSPQATVVKTLEQEEINNLDYAMLLIRWAKILPGNIVKLPRVPVISKPGRNFTDEMLLIGHPWTKGTSQGEPTQACAFKRYRTDGPNPDTGTGDTYCYGEFGFSDGHGFSGGGVFNEQSEIVGLLKGSPGDTLKAQGFQHWHFAFLDIGLAADHTMNDPNRGRLKLWLNTGNPLKQNDTNVPDPTFQRG